MKILLAIDGSQVSDVAVKHVGQRLWPADSEIRVIRVVPPVERGLLPHTKLLVFDELDREQHAEAHRVLETALQSLRAALPGIRMDAMLREGWPKEVIVNEATEWKADLIVVGSHGYGAIKRMFLGSVSLAVALNAPCSVEIVRMP